MNAGHVYWRNDALIVASASFFDSNTVKLCTFVHSAQ